jgi:hypothetical protein
LGFTGLKNDKVGPGDYDIDLGENITKKGVVGVTAWKKPEIKETKEK